MLRHILVWVILGLGLGGSMAAAQEDALPPLAGEWRETLNGLACPHYLLNDAKPDLMWALASAFTGQSVVTLAEAAGFADLEGFFAKTGSINSFDNRWALMQQILEANPGATARLRKEVGAHGANLCPALSYVAKAGLQQVARLQINERAYWQPHAELAQIVINAKDCGRVDVDGFFGPSSRTAWGESGLRLSGGDGTLPTPGDIAELAQGTRSCLPVPMGALLVAIDSCHADKEADVPFEALGTVMGAIMANDPDGGLQTLQPALNCIIGPLSWSSGDASQGVGAITDLVEMVPLSTGGWIAAQQHMRDKLGFLKTNDGASLADAVGVELIARHGNGDLGLLGLALMAQEAGGIDGKALSLVLDAGFSDGDVKPAIARMVEGELALINDRLARTDYQTGETLTFGDGTLTLDTYLTMDQVGEFMGFVATIDTAPLLAAGLLDSKNDQLNYAYATVILEGFTPGGRRPDVARAHFKAAADRGHAPSLFRLALMTETGFGGPANPDLAFELYVKAAAQGESGSALTLAQRFEDGQEVKANWDKAAQYYAVAVANMRPAAAAMMVHGRLASQSPFWEDGAPGGRLLNSWAAAAMTDLAVGEDGEPEWSDKLAQYRHHQFAYALAHMFSDSNSGLMLDMHRAAQWLRVAGGMEFVWDPGRSYAGDDFEFGEDVATRLQRIVALYPELAAHPLEAVNARDADTPEGVWNATRDAEATKAKVRELCAARNADRGDDCLRYLHRAAVGAIAPQLIAQAFDLLVTYSNDELDEIRRFGRLKPDQQYQENGLGWLYNRHPEYTASLVDVLAFFGDYHAAEARSRLARWGDLDKSVGPLRRQIARASELDAPNVELESFLAVMARNQGRIARDLLESYRAPKVARVQPELEVARARFSNVEHLTSSRAIANTARRLATLEATGGDTIRATELELIAMKSDMARHAASALTDGRMAARLAEVCTLSRSSERLFGYGAREIALTFAKQAVNSLQDTRREIAALPERVQLCFRAQVEGHYRWLAELFIAENRPEEASRVLEMLKSFESFEFANRALALTGESFDKLPMMGQEVALIDAVARIEPAQNALTARRLALRRLANSRDLTAGEQQELAALNTTLADAAERREATRTALIEAAKAVGRADANTRLNPGKSIKRYLRKGREDTAAILQYVVLPDRMGLVMTTGTHQRVWGWDSFGDAPFDEVQLNLLIAEFREQLRTPASDPRDLARRLGDILLPPEVRAELDAAKVETLILSLDRQLRYLPVAALHDGESWLAATFTLTHVNRAGLTASTEDQSARIAAFGVTQAHQGFVPLPAVADEVNLLVAEGGGDIGILSGKAALDGDFTRDTLVDALIFSDEVEDRMGIVHLASHFKFGTTEADSFLLLGDGSRLSVRDIREGLGQDADMAEVALLTLSACETAYGETDSDGRELESFAAIAQHQGARAVMASLWPVADSSTAALMVAFYQRYNAGLPVAEALRGAQMALMTSDPEAQGSSRRTFDLGAGNAEGDAVTMPELPAMSGWEHPFYWAPFILLEGSV